MMSGGMVFHSPSFRYCHWSERSSPTLKRVLNTSPLSQQDFKGTPRRSRAAGVISCALNHSWCLFGGSLSCNLPGCAHSKCAVVHTSEIFSPRSIPVRVAVSRGQTCHCQAARPLPASFELRIRHARKISFHGQLRLELSHLGERLARLIHTVLRDERDRQSPPGGRVHTVEHQRRARKPFGLLVLTCGKLRR